jgi:hypothetical protein
MKIILAGVKAPALEAGLNGTNPIPLQVCFFKQLQRSRFNAISGTGSRCLSYLARNPV